MPEGRQRVFFALWPEAEVARALHHAARLAHAACGGRLMQRDTLHMTLAFLGDVDAVRLDAASEAATLAAADVAGKVGAGGAAMMVDRLGFWRHNRIVWAGCVETPRPLADLAGALAQRLRERDFALESRAFVAHATLLRNAQCRDAVPQPEPVSWPVRDFVLVASQLAPEGPHYRILRRWALA